MVQNRLSAEPFILFDLAGVTYAVRSRSVRQMEMVENITPVPRAPAFVEGVVFVRGQVIPAIDLRVRFGFPKVPYTLRTRLMVIQTGTRVVGFIVDTAREFITIPQESIQPPPETISGANVRYLEGITNLSGRLVFILNPEAVLRPEEQAELELEK